MRGWCRGRVGRLSWVVGGCEWLGGGLGMEVRW